MREWIQFLVGAASCQFPLILRIWIGNYYFVCNKLHGDTKGMPTTTHIQWVIQKLQFQYLQYVQSYTYQRMFNHKYWLIILHCAVLHKRLSVILGSSIDHCAWANENTNQKIFFCFVWQNKKVKSFTENANNWCTFVYYL